MIGFVTWPLFCHNNYSVKGGQVTIKANHTCEKTLLTVELKGSFDSILTTFSKSVFYNKILCNF